jgi:nucleoside-diphosphate-sugar epimerase
MRQPQPVLVIGGTRGTGLLIARLLHQQGLPVRVLARDRVRAMTLFDRTIEVVSGDVTKIETLPPAIDAVRHIIFTAGCRSGYPVREARVIATEYHGVLNTLAAARQQGFVGRFLYMTSSGVMSRSVSTVCLNLWKGNTLIWRSRAESEIRASGLDYTIVRTGILLNRPGRQHMLRVTQRRLPLSLRYRIARADVAEVFLAALEHDRASRATFEVVWGPRGRHSEAWSGLLDALEPDTSGASAATPY